MIKKTGSLDQALNRILASKNAHVKVGVMPNSKYEDGTYVATVAFKNEYGFENIPSRPFMRSTVDEQRKAWVEMTKKGIKAGYTIDHTLNLVGLQMQQDIQHSIMTWVSPPNSAYTVAKKGFNSPLRQSLLMHDSITYELEDDS